MKRKLLIISDMNLKRWIIVIGMMLCAWAARAQEQDIVRESDPWYMFREHGDLVSLRDPGVPFWNRGWTPAGCVRQYSDKHHDDVTVYGVAVTVQYLPLNDTREYRAASMAPVFTVYQHIGGGAPPTWQLLDSANVDGLVKRTRFEYQTVQEDYVVPCYELYFDTPHHFYMPTDSFFYVGYIVTEEKIQRFDEYWRSELNSNADSFWVVYDAYAGNVTDTAAWVWALSGPDTGVFWPWVGPIGWGEYFPIVQLRCTPTKLFTVRPGNGTAEVTWRRKDFPEFYQVALASASSQPESGVMVATTDSIWTFDGLQAGTEYSVWVRKACRYTTAGYDTLVYSEWSAPMTFTTLGIGEVEADGMDFAVSPNPVHGMVEVTLPQPLEADGLLSLYDLGGREVRQTVVPAGSSRVAFDTEGCPAGAYLLKLISPQGISTRRLLVN